MLADLERRLKRALDNPEFLNLKSEIGILATRADDLLLALQEGEPTPDFSALKKQVGEITAGIEFGNIAKATAACRCLIELLEKGEAEKAAWSEIRETFRDIERLTKTQTTHEVELQLMFSAQDVSVMISQFVELLYRFISDDSERRAFTRIIRTYWDPKHLVDLGEPRNVTPED